MVDGLPKFENYQCANKWSDSLLIDRKRSPKHTVHVVSRKDMFEFVFDASLHNTVKVAGATSTVAAH